jgi:hypothetical protein
MGDAGRQKPSGTLASAADSNAVVEHAPQVTVADARPRDARGVAPIFVIGLVAFALAAGFLLGWALRGI